MYVKMVWQITTLMCVMEEKYYGFEEMKQLHHLMQGKRTASWKLTISREIIYYLVVHLKANGGVYGVGLGSRIMYRTTHVVLSCVFTLMWWLSQSVLYFACKSHHRESVDESYVSDKHEHINNISCRFWGVKKNGSYLPIGV
ncbi:hypothetical protein SUGI_1197200 [Cryptomeria japonica]|nr:hypothetical protein SUGI_1197200 [Cryptomeria japonica]